MNDLISRQDAIRWVKTECNPYGKPTLDFESGVKVIEHLKQMPSAEPNILDDGTLIITVPHGMLSKVNRVIVDEDGTKFCKIMYQDEMPSVERTDISEILQYLDEKLHPIVSPEHWNVYSELHDMISTLSAERVGKWVVRHPMRYDGKFVGADTDIIPDTRIRHLYCGECDKQMPIFEKFPYCPYCGARMVSE